MPSLERCALWGHGHNNHVYYSRVHTVRTMFFVKDNLHLKLLKARAVSDIFLMKQIVMCAAPVSVWVWRYLSGCVCMIYMIRHGKTDKNTANVLQGRSDIPLNGLGIKEAEDAAKKLSGIHFFKVFSSPLIRAVDTARIVAPGTAPVIDPRLIEMDYGPYEGVGLLDPPKELMDFFADFANNPAPSGMESLDSVVRRLGEFLEEIKTLPGNILISTHAIALKGALEYLTPASNGSFWGKYIGNCDIYVANNHDGIIDIPYKMP